MQDKSLQLQTFVPGKMVARDFLAGLGEFALVGLRRNICQLTLVGYHTLKT